MKRTYVVAALAVFAVVAIATPGFGLSGSIKKAIKKEVAKQTKPGPAGATGATGAAGAPGVPVGGGLMSGRMNGMPVAGVNFGPVTGIETSTGTFTNVTMATANTAVVGRDLFVHLDTMALSGTQTREFRMVVNADPNNGLNCTVKSNTNGGDGNNCASTGTVSIPAGSTVYIQETPSLAPNAPPLQNAQYGWSAVAP